MPNKEIKDIVDQLELIPHPIEGGYFKEVYRSEGMVPKSDLNNFNGDRSYCTSIYFLQTSEMFSAFHRIKQDEVWHFYKGSPLYIHVIDRDGNYTRHEVGSEIKNGHKPQLTVPAGSWFASSVKNENDYSFVGCTVAPGFEFEDFEMAKKSELIRKFPEHKNTIERLTN